MPSSLPIPVASSSTLRIPRIRDEQPIYRSYLFALGAVLLLALLGGGSHALALGAALVLAGAALIWFPPRVNPGRMVNYGVLGMLAFMALGFLPSFYWPQPEWRTLAAGTLGVDLPGSVSVRPGMTFEAFLLTCAGFSWLYVLLSLPVNGEGRRNVLLCLSGVVALLAGLVAAGNLYGWVYPGSQGNPHFSFFPDRAQMAGFLAIGGVMGFAYGMEGLRRREGEHLLGLLAAVLVLLALMQDFPIGAILLFFGGIFVWFVLRLFYTSTLPWLKIGLPVALLLYSFLVFGGGPTLETFRETLFSPSGWGGADRFAVYDDSVRMLRDHPVSGVGAGNFATVFPQYRDASMSVASVTAPASDVLWLAAECGVPVLVFLALFLFGLLRRFFPLATGRNAHYQLVALTGLFLFLLYGLTGSVGHHPATAFFALVVLALALPSRLQRKAGGFLPRRFWRISGGVLAFIGCLWMAAGAFNLPLSAATSLSRASVRAERAVMNQDFPEAAAALDKAIAKNPLDWRLHSRRARAELSWRGDKEAAATGFERARFVEPKRARVPYEEGIVWIPFDLDRAVAAWREALVRGGADGPDLFRGMLRRARDNYRLWQRIKPLSMLEPEYRVLLLERLRGREFANELETELTRDPALQHFDQAGRGRILDAWIRNGDLDTAEAFLDRHGGELEREWYHWSSLRYQQARFEEAVEIMRESLEPPAVLGPAMEDPDFRRLTRAFAADTADTERGTLLFQEHIKRGENERALAVLEALLEAPGVPAQVHYWRGEMLYRKRDFIDSWNAFDVYVEQAF